MTTKALETKRWFRLQEAVSYSGLSEETLRRLSKAGRLTPRRPTGRVPVLYDRTEIDRLIESSAPQPAA